MKRADRQGDPGHWGRVRRIPRRDAESLHCRCFLSVCPASVSPEAAVHRSPVIEGREVHSSGSISKRVFSKDFGENNAPQWLQGFASAHTTSL